jgi:hypothetical protein
MAEEGTSRSGRFMSSLPGIMAGLAALITAVGGIYALTRDGSDSGSGKVEGTAVEQAAVNATVPPAAAAPSPGTNAAPPAEAAPEAQVAPGTCLPGFVWREARPGDRVCVTTATRAEVAEQNATPDLNRAEGSLNCLSGYVWREAFDGDTICVDVATRARTRADNAEADDRVARLP